MFRRRVPPKFRAKPETMTLRVIGIKFHFMPFGGADVHSAVLRTDS
jgi:hypothetical protein